MKGYGWDEYDARTGGIQSIHDTENKIDLSISFVKIPGGSHGGSWAARVKGQPTGETPEDLKTMVLLYVSQEGLGNVVEAIPSEDEKGYDDDVTLKGQSTDLGDFKLVVTKGTGESPVSEHELSEQRDLSKTVVQSLTLPEEHIWQAKPIVFRQLKEGIDGIMELYDPQQPPPPWQIYQLANRPGVGNVHLVQKVFQGPFEFDILFSSESVGKDLTSAYLTREIKSTS